MEQFYSPKGMVLWDSWFIKKGDEYHLFHLQALPPPPDEPEKRHDDTVSIGHAVSTDLIDWKELPVALVPGTDDAWDNQALWTGSVIEKDGKYYMFYTGRNKEPNVKWIQKIGVAISDDLMHWKKHEGNPILEADNEIYEMRNERNAIGKVGAWRDPHVFQDPKTKKYYMLIAARKKGPNTEYNGCVAIAESDDLLNWKVLPPLIAPDVYDEMEVPQMIIHDRTYYLFFSTFASNYKPEYAKKVGSFGGRHCYYSNSLFGKYKPINKNGVVYPHEKKIYDLTIVSRDKNTFTALGWLNKDPKGRFIGKLSHPIKMEINKDRITVKQ
jgi:beta-fructofuranosidase